MTSLFIILHVTWSTFFLAFINLMNESTEDFKKEQSPDLRCSTCVTGVQNAGLSCTTLCMMLGPPVDPTVWLHVSLRLCSFQTASRIMSGDASEGSRQSLKYVTTGGVWLSLYCGSHRAWFLSRFVFNVLKEAEGGVTTLGSSFIIVEMTLDTSERNISYQDMTSFWF